ncbi:MAG TPA: helix-turn-helix domain-containing protein, partial [Actinoplanes sp.]|nr:helix-turn-helix domain-containing protein [Actinoplanes sp.]
MKRANGKSHCPINYGLEIFGDPWSLLIVRDIVYFGKHTFKEFLASEEAIAPSVLSARLTSLEAAGILVSSPDPADRRRVSYRLTETGLRLIPILLEIAAWSARVDPETQAPIEWIETVARNKPEMIELITTTVRNGGAVFVGENSVLAQLGEHAVI